TAHRGLYTLVLWGDIILTGHLAGNLLSLSRLFERKQRIASKGKEYTNTQCNTQWKIKRFEIFFLFCGPFKYHVNTIDRQHGKTENRHRKPHFRGTKFVKKGHIMIHKTVKQPKVMPQGEEYSEQTNPKK